MLEGDFQSTLQRPEPAVRNPPLQCWEARPSDGRSASSIQPQEHIQEVLTQHSESQAHSNVLKPLPRSA